MFKKLKDKIAEEVKSSPSRIQQIAQAAQSVVSSTTSSAASDTITASEKFFSITEEDTPQNSPQHKVSQLKSTSSSNNNNNNSLQISTTVGALNNGDIPLSSTTETTTHRLRRLSNTSFTSDASFRLPTYDSPIAYHLQSDLDISASEIEDGGGGVDTGSLSKTSSPLSYTNHLELISKEQLHEAYKRSSERYQKYRLRYTELAKRYHDLERDNNKARNVLVETQDKALRRISELREQCSLEQQAKAHLESALRLEMDEMQCVIKTLKTKNDLLEQNPRAVNINNGNLLMNSLSDENYSKNDLINLNTTAAVTAIDSILPPNDSSTSNNLIEINKHLEEQLNEEKCKLIIKNEENSKLNKRLEESKIKINQLKTYEDENNILLAENKRMIHSELNSKETEVKKLKETLNQYESDLKASTIERTSYQQQLILLKQQEAKLNDCIKEMEYSIKSFENKSTELTNEKHELEAKLIVCETEKHEMAIKMDAEIKRLNTDYNNLLCKNEDNYLKMENDLRNIKEAHADVSEKLNALQLEKSKMENQLLESSEKFTVEKNLNNQLQLELNELNELKTILELRLLKMNDENQLIADELRTQKFECTNQQTDNNNLNQQILMLTEEIKNIKIWNENSNSVTIQSLQNSMKHNIGQMEAHLNDSKLECTQKTTELKQLQMKLNVIEKEKLDTLTDLQTLREKIDALKNEKRDLEKTLEKEIRDKTELKAQVTNILQEICRLEEQLTELKNAHSDIEHEKLQLEKKTEEMQSLNLETQQTMFQLQSQLREMDVQLQQVQCENTQLSESNCLLQERTRTRLQNSVQGAEANVKTAEMNKTTAIGNDEQFNELNDQLTIANDEINKLQSKLNQCIDENSRLFNAKELMEHEFRSLQDQCETIDKEKLCVLDTNKCLEEKLNRLRIENEAQHALEREKNNLAKTCDKLRDDMEMYRKENESLQILRDKLQMQFNVDTDTNNSIKLHLEQQLTEFQQNYVSIQSTNKVLMEKNDDLTKEIQSIDNKTQNRLIELENLLKRTNDEKQSLKESIKNATDFEKKLENYEQLKIENEYLNTLVKQLESDLYKNGEEKNKFDQDIINLNVKLKEHQSMVSKYEFETHQQTIELQKLRDICQRSQNLNEQFQLECGQQKEQFNESIRLITTESEMKLNKLENVNASIEKKNLELEKLNRTYQNDIEQFMDKNTELQMQLKKLNTDLTANAVHDKEFLEMNAVSRIQLENNNKELQIKIDDFKTIINDLKNDMTEQTEKRDSLKEAKETKGDDYNNELRIDLENVKTQQYSDDVTQKITTHVNVDELTQLKSLNECLKLQLADSARISEGKILNLNNEIDELLENAKAYREKQIELDQLRVTYDFSQKLTNHKGESQNPQNNIIINGQSETTTTTIIKESDELKEELNMSEMKLKRIMHEVQDVSNRNLFLEQKCENYLILEQSNERLKLQNDKLSRQLDETLVSMQHTENIGANTEFEYLRNIMFQYLTNNINSNSNTLVKVIAAVLKFSPQQTQVALEKESQRNSLVGQINNLL